MILRHFVFAFAAAAASLAAPAAEVPAPGKADRRLRTIDYQPDQVTSVNIIKGVGTRIMLARDEKIRAAAPGFGSDCAVKEHDWCIVANPGDSDIYVKAKSGAKEPNNLEVTTDKRVYSFDFMLNPAWTRDQDGFFRVTFRYPEDERKAAAAEAEKQRASTTREVPNRPVNWNYTMDAPAGSEVIAPSRVFDDGRFIRLTFPANRLMPEVFVVEADGTESLPATHVDKDTIVVHRLYKRLVLRRGTAAIGIWNESFNPDGISPVNGTTVDGLVRVIRGRE